MFTQAELSMIESGPFGMLGPMKTTGDRIRSVRKDLLELTQAQFADRLGVTRGAVGNWELNKGIKAENLTQIADEFGISADWLINGRGIPPTDASAGLEAAPTPSRGNATAPRARPIDAKKMLPVYGKAVGGDDGKFVLNGVKVGEVFAPASLEFVPDAYSVYVHGTSMEPRYSPGEGVWIHPHRPVKAGDYVVAQLAADAPGEPPYGFVKRFISRNSKELVLEQLNPPTGEDRLMRFPSASVVSVHKIIGSFED